jgi:hypothetical protein
MNPTPEPLVVDRSVPRHVDERDLHAWATTQTVFVSSVMAGMVDERTAVADAVERVGAQPVLFERLGGRDDDAETAYFDGVRSSDIYVGILGQRYGRPGLSGYSATHAEYLEAVRSGLRISVWHTTESLDGHQNDFLEEVRVFQTTGVYASPDELGMKVEDRIKLIAAESLSPWCKVDSALFRASRFADTGDRITIEAVLRDDAVVAALEQLRSDRWSRSRDTRITCASRTYRCQVDAVVVESTSGRAKRVTIEARRLADDQRSTLHEVAFGSRSADDLTELAVRVALFGEPNPLDQMSFMAEMSNPFGPLNAIGLGEDAIHAVGEVLLTEALVGSGRAQRITALRLGPSRRGSRRVMLEWLPRQRYTNVIPVVRRVEGEVRA